MAGRATTLLVILAIALSGCSSAVAPRSSQEPAVSQYKGWTVNVTPTQIDANRWRPRVRVWPPEAPPGHPGITLSFSEMAGDRRSAVEAGNAAARRYIDSSQVEHIEPR